MFHKCSEKCLCASTPSSKKETVLYCFGEVVLERPSLRPGGSSTEKDGDDEAFLLHVIQLVAIALLLTALLFVLLSIRTGVLRLKKQLKRLLEMMMMMTGSPPASKCGTPVR